MKQPLLSGYGFSPINRTLDFSTLANFDLRRLFAVINLRSNALIYAAAVPNLGYASVAGSVLTLAYDTSAMNASDPLLVIYEDGGAPLPANASTAAGQADASAKLASILSVLQAQVDLETSIWTDGTAFYVRRESVNEGTQAIAVTFTNPDGSTASVTASSLRPVASDNAITLLTAYFDVKTAGTGYSLGDVVARVVGVNKATTPPTASSAIWLNMTTGAVIAAPAAANIAEVDQNTVVTAPTLAAALGSATDTAATTDAGTFSLIALFKRGLAYWTTYLARVPVLGQALKAASVPVTMASDQGALSVSQVDGTIPSGSPVTLAATANAAFTFDTTGAGSVDIHITAFGGVMLLEQQASDGSNNWQPLPATFISNVGSSQGRTFNTIISAGIWRASVGGKTLRLRNNGATANTFAIVLKASPWSAPSTYIEGGSLVANSSTVTADTSGTIAAGASVAAVTGSTSRQLAIISNTGTNPMQVRFGGAATAAVGHTIAAGANLVLDAKCPTAAINLFSASGTTYSITTG
ncbi:hypothetical protein [Methylobacterium sp. WL6]|uniref:hypothetical protein n=1 Tax=Methylobacterium sp. WL6 TaxID=2603901 RepID=UPI0011CA6CC7|nr:hypothetical protein [Methylobacterium sp. WL6]TXN64992.1 hypothetical protein FV230_17605 [Methylobacterium sp. WL6]